VSGAASAYLHLPGSAELRWLGETSTFFLADGERTGEAFALVDERAVLGESVPLHRHDDVESFYVLEGEVTFFLGDERGVTAGPGSFAHVPAGAVHGFRVASEEARYLILTTPRHGRFYRAITLPSQPDGQPPQGSVDGATIRAAAVEYGIELVGPLPV
jgi:quercetin dioxygenase-like cupin family protein